MVEYYKNKDLDDLPGEEWRRIKGYESLYAISNLGRIKGFGSKSVYTVYWGRRKKQIINADIILAQKKHNRGYKTICLSKNKNKKYTTIHRLVAEAFITNPENKRTVNHKNGVKWDNRVDNLEWATDTENGNHSFKELGRKGSKTYLGKFGKEHNKSKPLIQFNLDGNFIKEWENAQQVYRELGFHAASISASCIGRNGHNQFGGFLWKFANDKMIPKKSTFSPKVTQLSESGDFIKEYANISVAAVETGFDRSHIGRCAKKNKLAYGFKWKYA